MNIWQVLQLERPIELVTGYPSRYEDLSTLLPGRARDKGLSLGFMGCTWPLVLGADPVMIHDRDGNLLYCWPEDYIPGVFEVEKVCAEILRHMEK